MSSAWRVSFVVAARDNGHSDKQARDAAVECVRAYREHLRECSKKSPLDVWYERLDVQALIEQAPDAKARKRREQIAAKARQRIGEYLFPKISARVGGRHRLVDQPPLLFHVAEKDAEEMFREAMEDYRAVAARLGARAVRPLPPGRLRGEGGRHRQRRHALPGRAVLLRGRSSAAAAIQGGLPSVLAPYAGKSVYENQGQRVVVGQRLMQSASDIFLGWTRGRRGYRLLRAPVAGHEVLRPDRRSFAPRS